jgi:hypothetical protein
MANSFVLSVRHPAGSVEPMRPHAKRLSGLNGRKIGELSNAIWEDARTFPLIRELLKKRFPEFEIVPFNQFPMGTAPIDDEATIDRLVEEGCDAVITGNAA